MTASEKNGCSPAVAAPVDHNAQRVPQPGPWVIRDGVMVDLNGDDVRFTGVMLRRSANDVVALANACLAAAAPDLLAALKVARDHVRFFCEEVDDEGSEDCKRDLALVDAAIAKAESR